MKKGRFFTIPEGPGDIEALRRQAAPLGRCTRPVWLDESDAGSYRHLGSYSTDGLTEGDLGQFHAESEQLRVAGLVVDQSSESPEIWRVYVPSSCGYDAWSIGIYAGHSPLDLHPASGASNPVLRREDVSDVAAVLVADPFMVHHRQTWFMFFEILNWRSNKGEIGLATSGDGLEWTYRQRVLVEPFHLSYPYVFENRGSYYMIPEARQSGSVRLYRALDFPRQWEYADTLLQRDDLVDASVLFRDGYWWMLAGTRTHQDHDTLCLFLSESLTGPWKEHPSSPIVRDNPRAARPAGRILDADGRLLRFAQNCESVYGLDVRAFEITELTSRSYREVETVPDPLLKASGVGWNACGMHHVDGHRLEDGSWLACVDGWSKVT